MKRHIGQAVSRGGRIEPKGQVQVERQLVERARKRVDGLLIELAEVRIDAMISGCEAAVLRPSSGRSPNAAGGGEGGSGQSSCTPLIIGTSDFRLAAAYRT